MVLMIYILCICLFDIIGAANFREAMRIGAEIYQTLKKVIKEKYGQDGKITGSTLGIKQAQYTVCNRKLANLPVKGYQ